MALTTARPDSTGAALERLSRLHPRLIDLSLDRVHRLLARLGHPERRLPPVVHVAGTNGKGSLIAFLRAMAEADGRRVHVYTSPHLVRFNERIRIQGAPIPDDHLLAVLEAVESRNAGEPITTFEITTIAAMMAFAESPADLLLLETGLGGRLDATNVIDRPLLTAITPVSIDHAEFLGADLAAIAFEKAGILKPGVPAVIGPQFAEAAAVIAARAAAVGSPLIRAGQDWQVAETGGGLLWRGGGETLPLPLPALAGPHQVVNAGMAVACARQLGDLAPPEAAIAAGLVAAEWPARLQRLRRGPLVDLLPGGEVWLDGGHNPSAGEALAAMLRRWRAEAPDRPHALVVAMKDNKDLAGFLRPMAGLAAALRGVAIPGDPACFSGADIAAAAAGLGFTAAAAADPADAVASLAAGPWPEPPRVLVCGSLYLAGAVLTQNG